MSRHVAPGVGGQDGPPAPRSVGIKTSRRRASVWRQLAGLFALLVFVSATLWLRSDAASTVQYPPFNAIRSYRLVSVMILAYNLEAELPFALNSALTQTYPNVEVLICDDNSSDGTLQVAYSEAQKDSRIRVIHDGHNGGMLYNIRRCTKKANGEFVDILDADDWIDQKLVESTMQKFLSYPDVSWVGFQTMLHPKRFRRQNFLWYASPVNRLMDRRYLFEHVMKGLWQPVWANKMYRRDILLQALHDVPAYFYSRPMRWVDNVLVIHIFNLTKNCYFISLYGYNYRYQYGLSRRPKDPRILERDQRDREFIVDYYKRIQAEETEKYNSSRSI